MQWRPSSVSSVRTPLWKLLIPFVNTQLAALAVRRLRQVEDAEWTTAVFAYENQNKWNYKVETYLFKCRYGVKYKDNYFTLSLLPEIKHSGNNLLKVLLKTLLCLEWFSWVKPDISGFRIINKDLRGFTYILFISIMQL